jgi:hypothetical protein
VQAITECDMTACELCQAAVPKAERVIRLAYIASRTYLSEEEFVSEMERLAEKERGGNKS